MKISFNSPSLDLFPKVLQEEKSLLIEGVSEGPKAFLLHLAQKTLSSPILFISSEERLSKLAHTLPFFSTPFLELPTFDLLPGEPPPLDLVGRRLEIFETISHTPHLLLTSLQGAIHKVPPLREVATRIIKWSRGDTLSFSNIRSHLLTLGYREVPLVSSKGEFAIRGSLVDLFPLSSFEPSRIDFFDDTIESIRLFDPLTQKTTGKQEILFLPPAEEPKGVMNLIEALGPSALICFDDLLALEDKSVSSAPAEVSFKELLNSSQKAAKTIFFVQEAIETLSDVVVTKREGRSYYTGKNPLQPLSFELAFTTITSSRWNHPFLPVEPIIDELKSQSPISCDPLWIAYPNQGDKLLIERTTKLPKTAQFVPGYLSSGFALQDSPAALLSSADFTHKHTPYRQKWRSSFHTQTPEGQELTVGDLVVHFQYGIGKYLGCEKQKNHQGILSEFLILEYAEGGKLFVPITQAHLVSKYIGTETEIPTLHTLGTKTWQNLRTKAQAAIVGYAETLLHHAAERSIRGGFAYPEDTAKLISFEQDFPYTETHDQLAAIAAIKHDMISSKAMDRLLCGDVGYGKTEVAMRAAFKAVADGKKQVAFLVPTTLLALQHFETLSDRMRGYGIRIGCISRFQSSKEIKETLEKLALGELDIIIGTHRLLSKDVRFHDLGLVIIDEEQKFGVRSKEHLKTLKVGVDCLTLSATPIPRTLYFSILGAKDLSTLTTPPQDRIPIKTVVAEKRKELLQQAIVRELSRDGQVFFIHNRVDSIFLVKEELQKLVPQAKIVVGHGQMSSEEIDEIFHRFKTGDVDLLIATTIIENGIDIPNANTILIDHAHRFGLADLYQMRGRVGRGGKPAYAYLLLDPGVPLQDKSRKRIQALASFSGFGDGMRVAMRDLEIRGAGDILGVQQSGQVASIGFHLYCKLLKRAIDALKNKKDPAFFETKLEFPFDAKLPETYVKEPSLRLAIYHKLGEALSLEEVDTIRDELVDRFGKLPKEALWLYHLTRIRVFAAKLRIVSLKFTLSTPRPPLKSFCSLAIEQLSSKESIKKNLLIQEFTDPQKLEEEVKTKLFTKELI